MRASALVASCKAVAVTASLSSPLGALFVTVDEAGRVLRVGFDAGDTDLVSDAAAIAHVARAFDAYFRGRGDAFDGLELAARGTEFQETVWRELRRIPFGATCTYGELAAACGRPGAARAVGMANHVNPIAIIVPCHRVISAGGRLVGYAAGLERKQALLAHERRDSLLFA